MLDRSSPVPLYHQLHAILLKEIQSGALKQGDAFPTEQELMERYAISRMTVRQAVARLVHDGLLHRQQGHGTFVRCNVIEQELSTLTGFSEEMASRGLTPSAKLVSAQMMQPDSTVATQLRTAPGEMVFQMIRVRLADGEPIALDLSHCPRDLGEKLQQENLEGALYSLMEDKFGIKLDWADQAIQAILADEFTSRHLGINKRVPILFMERTAYAADGRPVEFTRTLYRADRYVYRIRLKRKPRSSS